MWECNIFLYVKYIYMRIIIIICHYFIVIENFPLFTSSKFFF